MFVSLKDWNSICRMLSSSSLAKKSTLSSVDGRAVGNSSLMGAGERILLSLWGTSSKMSLRVISFEGTERLYHQTTFSSYPLWWVQGYQSPYNLKLALCYTVGQYELAYSLSFIILKPKPWKP